MCVTTLDDSPPSLSQCPQHNKHTHSWADQQNVKMTEDDTLSLLPRFGFDVPVILRTSDETESILPTPERQMIQVANPFALELGSGVASVTGENSHTQW